MVAAIPSLPTPKHLRPNGRWWNNGAQRVWSSTSNTKMHQNSKTRLICASSRPPYAQIFPETSTPTLTQSLHVKRATSELQLQNYPTCIKIWTSSGPHGAPEPQPLDLPGSRPRASSHRKPRTERTRTNHPRAPRP